MPRSNSRISAMEMCITAAIVAVSSVTVTNVAAQPADSAIDPNTSNAQPTIAEVIQRVSKLWEQHKSVTAKFVMDGRQTSRGVLVTVHTEGAFEYAKSVRGPLYRIETRTVVRKGEGDDLYESETTLLMVEDAKAHYRLTTSSQRPGPIAVKSASKPVIAARGGADLFEKLRQTNDLALLPDETLEGADCYVIEGKHRAGGPTMVALSHFYFRKSDGIRVKYVGFGPDNLEVQSTVYSDIKVDTDIDPKRFEFEAPDGVRVLDRS